MSTAISPYAFNQQLLGQTELNEDLRQDPVDTEMITIGHPSGRI